MLTTRRLAAALCALCLTIPAAANARFDNGAAQPASAPKSHVVYGDTKYDLQNDQVVGTPAIVGDTKSDVQAPAVRVNRSPAPVGDTKNDVVVPAGKTAGAIASLTDKQIAAAYGTARPQSTPVATHPSSISDDGDTNEWRIAAVIEAGLLAAFAVGAGLALSGRQRRRTAGLGV
jgi:hypothetical protein